MIEYIGGNLIYSHDKLKYIEYREEPIGTKVPQEFPYGRTSFIFSGYTNLEDLSDILGRNDICLKVYRVKYDKDNLPADINDCPLDAEHPEQNLGVATKIQNIAAFYNLAPRIFALVYAKIDDAYYPAQVTMFQGKDSTPEDWMDDSFRFLAGRCITKINNLLDYRGIKINYKDANYDNFIGGKWVDFHDFGRADISGYKDFIKNLALTKAVNVATGKCYQSIDKLGIEGQRDTKERIKNMKLEEIDFKGKDVLDLGCSAGAFCNYAASRGARRVVGIDLENSVEAAREISNYLGYYNIDYFMVDLKDFSHSDSYHLICSPYLHTYQIVFNMALSWYTKNDSSEIMPAVKEVMIFEGNGRDWDEPTVSAMKKNFKNVELVYKQDVWPYRPVYKGTK